MQRYLRLTGLLIVLMLIGTLIPPAGSSEYPALALRGELGSAQGVVQAAPPQPLPHDCDGVTPPGEDPPPCCAYGYVYYDGVPIAGASVHIESPYGALDTTTASGGASSQPYYGVDLSAAPLLVSPGDTITVTGAYYGSTASTVYEVAPDGQQVDVIITDNPLFGSGADGDLVVYSGQTIYTDDVRQPLSSTANAGQNTLSVPNTAGFAIEDKVLVIQMQGAEAGAYEFGTIVGVESGTLVLQQNLQNDYSIGGNSKTQVLRVPQYRNVTVQDGGTLTAHAWDGDTGGIVALACSEKVEIQSNGSIDIDKKGYRGGPTWEEMPDHNGYGGYCGEGEEHETAQVVENSSWTNPGNGNWNWTYIEERWGPNIMANGVGGGGADSDGNGGGGGSNGSYGGHGEETIDTWGYSGGHRGNLSPYEDLERILFGGGGGSGGSDGGHPGGGGNGGGIVILFAKMVDVEGTISSAGGDGEDGSSGFANGAGGGGAGGSILLKAKTAVLGNDFTTTLGGARGLEHSTYGHHGGAGGDGRIRVEYCESFSGFTNPPASRYQWECHRVPIVTIHTVYPHPAVQGQDTTTFRGSAVDNDEDGASITQYVWRSDLDGLLSTQAEFTMPASELSAGTHTIYFKAKDDEGEWSEEVSTALTVNTEPSPTPTATPPVSVTSTNTPTPTPTATPTSTPTPTPTPSLSPTWTFLLYLDGDNNLQPWLDRALNRLEENTNPHVNLLVLLDGAGSSDTWRYHVQPGGNYTDNVNRWYMGELDMSDPQTLTDFITWAGDNYPADHTYLAVADHGRGTTGIAWDHTSGSDQFITVEELRTALRNATADGTEPLDVVHYDACLMAMIEDAYQIKDYADYFIAAENLGWSVFAYDCYVSELTEATTPHDLAASIASEYHNHRRLADHPRTISALDLSHAGAVKDAVSDLATALEGSIADNKYYIRNTRDATQKFDSRDYLRITLEDEYLDLYHLAQLIKQNVPDNTVKDAAQGVMDAIGSGFVVAEHHESGTYNDNHWDLDDAHGVSIYFPPASGGYGYSDYMGHEFRFTADSEWDEFLLAYYGAMGLPPMDEDDPGVAPMLEAGCTVYLPMVVKNR